MATRTLTRTRAGGCELWLSSLPGPAKPESLLVLLHGFGAPGSDLVPLAEGLSAPAVAFPEAPIKLSDLPEWGGLPSGGDPPRAWWLIDVARFQRAAQQGRIESLVQERPAGIDEAAQMMRASLAALREQFGLTNSQICVGGFSQGAMLATELAVTEPEPLGGLAIFSGTLICANTWLPRLAARSWPIFISHGRSDPILPFFIAEQLTAQLGQPGAEPSPSQVVWVPFDGGHGIAPTVLAQFNHFWRQHFQQD